MSSELLREAAARVQTLPEEEQDRAAEILIAFTSESVPYVFTHKQIAGVEQAMDEADNGRFASNEQVGDFFAKS